MDDIVVYGAAQDEHDNRLKQVLQRIKDSGIKLNKEKCHISLSELNFLGHVVSRKGVHPSPQ